VALNSYSALQASLSTWLVRSDLDAGICADAIALAEADFIPDLRTREMRGRAAVAVAAGTQFVSLPPGFLELRLIRILDNSGQRQEITGADEGFILDRYRNVPGRPQHYAIVGDSFLLGPTPDAAYSLELDFYSFATLSNAAPSNWLLTKSPGIYLFGALLQLMPYIRNDQRADFFQAKFDAAIGKLHKADKWSIDPAGSIVSMPHGATP
jgi:hypothetical protein